MDWVLWEGDVARLAKALWYGYGLASKRILGESRARPKVLPKDASSWSLSASQTAARTFGMTMPS